MKNKMMFAAVLSVVCLSTAAFGLDPPKREGQGGQNPPRRQQGGVNPEMAGAMIQRMPLFLTLDADKDGDGALSPEELRPDFAAMAREGMPREGQPGANGAPGKEMMARMFEQRDVNKDGKLSGDEIPERMQQNVSRMDENGDGAIDKSEMEKAMAKMGDRAGQVRGAKGDKDGAGVKPKRPSAE